MPKGLEVDYAVLTTKAMIGLSRFECAIWHSRLAQILALTLSAMASQRSIARSACLLVALTLGACGGATRTDQASSSHDLDAASASDAAGTAPDLEAATTSDTSSTPSDGDATAAPSDAGACTGCLTHYDLHWSMDGGLVLYVDMSLLGPCRGYTHQRVGGKMNAPLLMCHADVPGCPARTIDTIERLQRDPAIITALARHSLFGVDSRAVDGQVFQFGVGTDYVDVGSPCAAGASNCVPAPAPVQQLVDVLQGLDQLELATDPCKSVFGK